MALIYSVKIMINQIEKYLHNDLSGDELEQFTMGIIGDDDFDNLDEEVQDLIYTLDSRELNELSTKQIIEIQSELKRLLGN